MAQRRDAHGRFAGGGIGAVAGRRSRLRKNEQRVAENVKALAGISGGTMGRSEGVRKQARKLSRSQAVNARAQRAYRARARGAGN